MDNDTLASVLVGPEQAHAGCGCARPACDAEDPEQRRHMHLDGALTEVESTGNLLVGQALHNQLQNLLLAMCKLFVIPGQAQGSADERPVGLALCSAQIRQGSWHI